MSILREAEMIATAQKEKIEREEERRKLCEEMGIPDVVFPRTDLEEVREQLKVNEHRPEIQYYAETAWREREESPNWFFVAMSFLGLLGLGALVVDPLLALVFIAMFVTGVTMFAMRAGHLARKPKQKITYLAIARLSEFPAKIPYGGIKNISEAKKQGYKDFRVCYPVERQYSWMKTMKDPIIIGSKEEIGDTYGRVDVPIYNIFHWEDK
jgi:hypothetical protein